ncbi:hypothetical protein [Isoalcanivorax beigongshangi]|uniref:Uncharacterized protein n=1 Tax=Isoalcanivorax beigongshangi TaxID=3238810 RepID=A0ABV4AHQ6_9GAMM
MTLSETLKALANGLHPLTGEMLPEESVTHQPAAIRLLFALAEEFAGDDGELSPPRRRGGSLDEKRQRNLDAGLPANSGLPWSEQDHALLHDQYQAGVNLSALAERLERRESALVARLQSMGLMSDEQAAMYRVLHKAVLPPVPR